MAVLHEPVYSVEESVLEKNPKTGTPREIDILITERGNPSNKIMVECRDWKRKQDVIWIDQLDGKARSLGISRVIAVSSSGFHETTLKEASSRGIETMHLADAQKQDVANWLFRISEFGLEIDYPPVVKRVELITLSGVPSPDLTGISASDIYLVNTNEAKKIALADYIAGLVNNPKIVEYVRANNVDNATTHYTHRVPCDRGVGYCIDGTSFIPLSEIVFLLDSSRQHLKVPMTHMRAGNHKILVGDVDKQTKLVLEETEGQLKVMIETRVENKQE